MNRATLRRPAEEAGRAAPRVGMTGAARTDIGLVRGSNEDAFLARPAERLWVVADGMGGHEDGEWASAAIVQALGETEVAGDFEADCSSVAQSVLRANGVIYARAEARRLRIGSTVVVLLVGDGRFAVFWAGDSRAYRLRGDALVQLTTDHTQVQSKVARGLMTPAEARGHPMAHVLSRAVGAEAQLDLSSLRGDTRAGDVFLLCSDGLHGAVPEAKIAAVLADADPAQACETLIGLCYAQGAPDNVTLAVVALAAQT